MKKIKCFTHNDMDGVMCYYLLRHVYGKENVDVSYCNYNNINPSLYSFIHSKEIDNYDKVFITDISIKDTMCKWIDRDYSNKVVLIDHHIGESTTHLNNYSWCTREGEKLDKNEQCSATWLLYNRISGKNKTLDYLVHLVDYYDTYLWKKTNTIKSKLLNDLLYIIGKEDWIEEIDKQVVLDKGFEFTDLHNYLFELREREYKHFLESCNLSIRKGTWRKYKVGVVFASKFISELGNDLATMNPELDFIIMINFQSSSVSIRGIKENIHLGDIAQIIGGYIYSSGGGHPMASGIALNDDFIKKIITSTIINSNFNNFKK